MKRIFLFFAAILFVLGAPAQAADLDGMKPYRSATQCHPVQHSALLDIRERGHLNAAVIHRFEHALAVSERPRTVNSRSPLFTWAITAKVYCAQALGYLKSGEVVADTINRCDCSYKYMLHHLPRR